MIFGGGQSFFGAGVPEGCGVVLAEAGSATGSEAEAVEFTGADPAGAAETPQGDASTFFLCRRRVVVWPGEPGVVCAADDWDADCVSGGF